jgi:lysophospholipase L1-like esterase
MPPSVPAGRRRVFQILLLLVPLTVIGLGVQVVLPRVVTLPVLSYHFWGNRPVTLLPGVEHRARGDGYDVRFRTNSLGMNDVEHSRERVPGVVRVLVLGDSYVEANQVPPEQHFARRLEALAAAAGERVEVIAMGASNQGQSHQLANYVALGRAYDPDVVVTFFCVNDPWNNLSLDPAHDGLALYTVGADGRLLYALAGRPEIAPTPAQIAKHEAKLRGGGWSTLRRLLRRAYDLYTTDERSRMAARMAALYHLPPDAGPAVREDEERMFELLVTRLREEVVTRDGRRLVAAIVSGEVDATRGDALLGFMSWATRAFGKEGVPLLDLDTQFRERARVEGVRPSWPDNPHWNETGHRWVAETLYAELAPILAARH